ncbi:MAG: LuxR C-terminal-related transcriptional regulator [Dethiosulfatibacter sp.]|nr:LuxR C-terminal-related transcriptional regulator [Dethiosulfatibacter sp.]
MINKDVIGREELKLNIKKGYKNYKNLSRDVLIVKGRAGIGKTYAVISILEQYSDIKVITCKQSKFEEDEFYIIKSLINSFFLEMLMFSDGIYKPLVYHIKNKIGKDLGYLANFSDLYAKIFSNIKEKEIQNYSKEKYKIRKAVRELLKLVSKQISSICIFFDDIQWSDIQSIDIIKSIIKDDSISAFFIISYRTQFEGFSKEEKVIPTLELQPFTENHVKKLVMNNTSDNIQNLDYLIRYLYSITLGNPFYIIKGIEELKSKGIIEDNIVQINKLSLTKTSDDIEGIMLARVEQLTDKERKILDYLVCLFGTADKDIIELLFDEIDLEDVIQSLKNKHFIFETPEKYIFTHDIILEYILENLDDKKTHEINFDIAYTLNKNDFDTRDFVKNIINTNTKTWMQSFAKDWFDEVYIFAQHSINNQSYENCKKAVDILEKAQTSIEIDEVTKLNIRLLLLKYKYIKGCFKEVENMFDGLQNQYMGHPLILGVYDEMLSFYKYTGKDQEVINIGKHMLDHIGYDYNVENINPLLTDLFKPYDLPKKFELVKNEEITPLYILYQIMPSAKNVSVNDFLYIILAMAKLSLEEKDSEYTLFGYAALSYVEFNMINRFEYGKYFSDMVLKNIEKLENDELKTEVLSFYLTFVHHWSNNLLETTRLLEEINTQCLENGIITYFSYTIASLLFVYSTIGKNIDESIVLINERTSKLYDVTLSESSFISKYINPMLTSYSNNFKYDSHTIDNRNIENIEAHDLISVWFEILSLFLKGNIKHAFEIVTAVTSMFEEAKGHIVYTDINLIAGLIRMIHHQELDYGKEENLKEIERIKNYFENLVKNFRDNHLPRHLYISGLFEYNFGNKYLSLGLINEGITLSKEKENYLLIAIGNFLALKINTENETLKHYYKNEMLLYFEKLGATAVVNIYKDQKIQRKNESIVDVYSLTKDELCRYILDTLYEEFDSVYSAVIMTDDQPRIAFENNGATINYDQYREIKNSKSINGDLITYSMRTKEEIVSKNNDVCSKCVPLNLSDTVVGILYLKYPKNKDLQIAEFINQYSSDLTIKLYNDKNDRNSISHELLSPRELGILKLLFKGKSNKEIGEIENISIGTVKSHLSNIYGKLEVNSRVKAVEKAKELNIL